MSIYIQSLTSCFIILFSIIDILASAPLIMDLRSRGGIIKAKSVTVASSIILISFLFLGEYILNIIGIDIHAFSVAGSIVLFIIALEMILGVNFHKMDEKNSQVSIIPVAFPIIAGPGSLTTLLSLRSEFNELIIFFALVLNLVIVYFVVDKSELIARKLGSNALNVIKKLFGIVLLSFAVKLFTSNADKLFALR